MVAAANEDVARLRAHLLRPNEIRAQPGPRADGVPRQPSRLPRPAATALQQTPMPPLGIIPVDDPEPNRDDLEAFWLGSVWTDLRRPADRQAGLHARSLLLIPETPTPDAARRADDAGPQNTILAGQFGEIAERLRVDGLQTEGFAPRSSTATPALGHPDGTRSATTDEVPREWTSRGPRWFYRLLTGITVAGFCAVVFISIVLTPNRDDGERDSRDQGTIREDDPTTKASEGPGQP